MIQRISPFTSLLTHGEQCVLVGKKARALREQRGLSRRELADKSGVSTATISRFELEGTATLSVMLKVADALGATETFESLFKVQTYASLDEFERGVS